MAGKPEEGKTSRLAELFHESETEYYGMPPFAFLDEIGEAVVEEILRLIERSPAVLESLIDFLSSAQIEAGLEQWADLVEQTVSKYFELFESYSLKNVLLLPESFVLPGQERLTADGSLEPLDQDISQLMADLQAEKVKSQLLRLKTSRLDREEATLAILESQFASLQSVLSTHSVTSLASALGSLDSQVDALRSIVKDTLEASSNAFAFDEDEIFKYTHCRKTDSSKFPLDTSLQSRLLALELKSCGAIGNPADVKVD